MYDEVYKDRSIVVLKKKRAKKVTTEEPVAESNTTPPETLMYSPDKEELRKEVLDVPVVESELSTERPVEEPAPVEEPVLETQTVWPEDIIPPPVQVEEPVTESVWSYPIPDENIEVNYVKPKSTVKETVPVVKKAKKGVSITTILMWVFGGYFVYDNYDRAQEYLASQGLMMPVVEEGFNPVIRGKKGEDDLVKIRNIKNFYLQADRGDGQIELRTGGNITWRYNNPGRVRYGDYAKKMGAIGSNGEVSIFPNYEMGKKAVYDLLFDPNSEYSKRTVGSSFISNKLDYILKKSGLKKDDVLKDLNASQRDALFKAVETAEGFTVGKVTIFPSEEDFKKRGW